MNIVDLAGSERRIAGAPEEAGFTSGASNSSLIPTRGRANVTKKASALRANNSPGADIYLSLKSSLGVPNTRDSQTAKGRARGKSFMVENVEAAD